MSTLRHIGSSLQEEMNPRARSFTVGGRRPSTSSSQVWRQPAPRKCRPQSRQTTFTIPATTDATPPTNANIPMTTDGAPVSKVLCEPLLIDTFLVIKTAMPNAITIAPKMIIAITNSRLLLKHETITPRTQRIGAGAQGV
jgi:hypothetical protein